MTVPEPPPIALDWLCDFHVEVAPAIEVGDTGQGVRRIIPITGGQVLPGKHPFSGRILPGGADFQWVVGGDTAHLDARYAIALDDGTPLYVVNTALRHAPQEITAKLMRGHALTEAEAAQVTFRCQPRFEVAATSPWAWLMTSQFVGSGVRLPGQVRMRFWRVG